MENLHSKDWILKRSSVGNIITNGEKGFVIAQITKSENITSATFEETEANANLIAAAPELLSALQYLLSSYKADFRNIKGRELNNTLAVEQAKQAINKAINP